MPRNIGARGRIALRFPSVGLESHSFTLMISLQVFYEGHVQGVGFRWSVQHLAKGFDVTGWVRNLPDGQVELQVQGEESEVCAFLDTIRKSELASLIRKQRESRVDSPIPTSGFNVRYD